MSSSLSNTVFSLHCSHVRFNISLELDEPDIVPGVGSLHAVVEVVETQTARQEEQQQSWEHQIY